MGEVADTVADNLCRCTRCLAQRWQDYQPGSNRAVLRGGAFANRNVRLYVNFDLWFECPWCCIVSAVDANNIVLRQYFIQPTHDFYTDYYEFQEHGSTVGTASRVAQLPVVGTCLPGLRTALKLCRTPCNCTHAVETQLYSFVFS